MKKKAPGVDMAKRLGEAVDQLKEDIHRVEIWAGALSGFCHPVPDYQPSEKHILPKTADASEKKSPEGGRNDL